MEPVSTKQTPHDTTTAICNLRQSLKKLKLRFCAEKQEHECLNIDEQKRHLDEYHYQPVTPCKPLKHEHKHDEPSSNNGVAVWPLQAGKGSTTTQKQQQKQSMRAAVESRRRLARGPRSGSAVADAQSAGAPTMPSEDHRVVSTDYQAAGTQAVMRVTLLAAGFVIGARGISARLIGQVTGAIVQSWTESCRLDSIPIRIFRIQGKKSVVHAAVALIEQAVAKYKDLCECKRRGEFVQREHVINGVEFYYQPPPRKAFANTNANANEQPSKTGDGGAQMNTSPVSSAMPYAPHHLWLQHLQQQQQQTQVQGSPHKNNKQPQAAVLETTQEQILKAGTGTDGHGQNHHGLTRQSNGYFDWQTQERQLMRLQSPDIDHNQDCAAELELIDHGLQQSVASLEQALQQVRLEQRILQRNRSMNNNNNNKEPSLIHHHSQNLNLKTQEHSLWSEMNSPDIRASQQLQTTAFQLGSSLFSIFGDGGLPLPISPPDERSDAGNHCVFLDSTPCTPFDVSRCDFLRESLSNFAWMAQEAPDYSLYEVAPVQEDVDDRLCIVCLEQQASVHLVGCGHDLFCFSCVGGLLTCPVCREPIVALHSRGNHHIPAPEAVLPKFNTTASSYHLWNWVPGASV